ncbi:hypothetical protein [Flavobacterium sp.]|uniref:hypothetical protein n=1 Tax=Flavobacterium sp. TaxID=239 RepID=UPI0025BD2259|nr:hypothetical protein [Flavobacterium sp.]
MLQLSLESILFSTLFQQKALGSLEKDYGQSIRFAIKRDLMVEQKLSIQLFESYSLAPFEVITPVLYDPFLQ